MFGKKDKGKGKEVAGPSSSAPGPSMPDIKALQLHSETYARGPTRLVFRNESDQVETVRKLPVGEIICVEQETTKVSFSIKMTHTFGRIKVEIFYNPASDACVAVNTEELEIRLEQFGQHDVITGSFNLGRRGALVVSEGAWRLHAVEDGTRREDHILDFLVLRRKHSVSVMSSEPRQVPSSSSKRKAVDGPSGAAKKAKTGAEETDVTGVCVKVSEAESPPRDMPLMEMSSATTSALMPALHDMNPFLMLDDGNHAIVRSIRDPTGMEQEDYTLTRIESVAKNKATAVYKGKHSQEVLRCVVKVLRPETVDAKKAIPKMARLFSNEVRMLKHCSGSDRIVRLLVSDSRFYTLVLEELPPDLTSTEFRPFTENQLKQILKDCATGLKFLKDHYVIHNDIKPRNISYSPTRGAVILDFGMAETHQQEPGTGGTFCYFPPEFVKSPVRTYESDVWSLGLTMLYVLNKMDMPEAAAGGMGVWQAVGVAAKNTFHVRRMEGWLAYVELKRDFLSREGLEGIVRRMLANSPAHRPSGKDIASLL